VKRAVEVQLAGLVQGVGFRWYARGQAQRLGVAGWVRNLDDGSVEAWIEGEDGGVVAMLRWLAQGPPSARVEEHLTHEREVEGYTDFEVRTTR